MFVDYGLNGFEVKFIQCQLILSEMWCVSVSARVVVIHVDIFFSEEFYCDDTGFMLNIRFCLSSGRFLVVSAY